MRSGSAGGGRGRPGDGIALGTEAGSRRRRPGIGALSRAGGAGRRWAGSGAGAACVWAAALALTAGCSPGGDVATLHNSPSPGQAGTSQADRAEAMAACLRAGDVPASTVPMDDWPDLAWVSIDSPHAVASQLPAGDNLIQASGEEQVVGIEAEQDQLPALSAKYTDPDQALSAGEFQPYLVIGATDFTEVLVKCLDQTGYANPEPPPADPADELREKQAQAEVTARWAGCARANGFPNTKDPQPPVADNFETESRALLPVTITESELSVLLEACPPYDVAAHEAWDQAIRDRGWLNPLEEEQLDELVAAVGYPYDPAIGFDFPGFRGDPSELDAATAATETAKRVAALEDVKLWRIKDLRETDPLLREVVGLDP